jgi:hypothetical protein
MDFSSRHNPTPTATAETESLVLEFQRVTARLLQAGAISRKLSARLVQAVSRSSLVGEELHRRLLQFLVGVLAGVEDGTLEQGVHVLWLEGGRLALHLESIGPALFRAQRCTLLTGELRRVCRFGWQHFRDVVVANSERVTFGPEEDRRRAVILDLARANEFVEKHQAAVPLGRERPRF